MEGIGQIQFWEWGYFGFLTTLLERISSHCLCRAVYINTTAMSGKKQSPVRSLVRKLKHTFFSLQQIPTPLPQVTPSLCVPQNIQISVTHTLCWSCSLAYFQSLWSKTGQGEIKRKQFIVLFFSSKTKLISSFIVN